MKICHTCSKELTGRQTKFCSTICKNTNSNHKFNNYEAQQKRAMERKIKFVLSLGGKCQQCGYDKNLSALTFHHRDPAQKTLKLDRRIMSNYTMERLTAEVSKCQLLCANCHLEHHHPNESDWCTRMDLNHQPRG